jgi:hypothetical protein
MSLHRACPIGSRHKNAAADLGFRATMRAKNARRRAVHPFCALNARPVEIIGGQEQTGIDHRFTVAAAVPVFVQG